MPDREAEPGRKRNRLGSRRDLEHRPPGPDAVWPSAGLPTRRPLRSGRQRPAGQPRSICRPAGQSQPWQVRATAPAKTPGLWSARAGCCRACGAVGRRLLRSRVLRRLDQLRPGLARARSRHRCSRAQPLRTGSRSGPCDRRSGGATLVRGRRVLDVVPIDDVDRPLRAHHRDFAVSQAKLKSASMCLEAMTSPGAAVGTAVTTVSFGTVASVWT